MSVGNMGINIDILFVYFDPEMLKRLKGSEKKLNPQGPPKMFPGEENPTISLMLW
jgi:hypothetical protein